MKSYICTLRQKRLMKIDQQHFVLVAAIQALFNNTGDSLNLWRKRLEFAVVNGVRGV